MTQDNRQERKCLQAGLVAAFGDTAPLDLFDAAAAALRDYDTETNGAGRMLLFCSNFPPSIDHKRKSEMLEISNTIHRFLKAHSVFFWNSWFGGSHKNLDEALNAARELLSKPSPDNGPSSLAARGLFLELEMTRSCAHAELSPLTPRNG